MGPHQEGKSSRKPLSPLAQQERWETSHMHVSYMHVCWASRRVRLAVGARLAWYRGGFNRKGKSEGPGGRSPLTPTQQGVSLLQSHQSHCSSTATHEAAALGLNSVGRTSMVTSVLVLPLIH